MNKRKLFLICGLLLLSVFVIMSLLPSLISPYGEKDMFTPWLSPSSSHLLGTNRLGYDVLTEIIHGTGNTLLTGFTASVISLLIGVLIGSLSAESGLIGHLCDGITDIMAMLPKLVLLIVLGSFFRGGSLSLIVLISALSWSTTARTLRARVLSLKQSAFIGNLKIEGFSDFHILVYHVIPNTSDILLSRFILGINSCIMMESTLSFLGFGDTFNPTWGTMVNLAYKNGAFMRQAYAYLLSPGICIMLLSLSFYFISLYLSGRKEDAEEAL
ncbi:MAG: ABC transporter permease [Sphaerochaetaceae bacterium]|nr:ABC transporter permease [Sphaerochaetaceae bacterium]